MHVMPILNPSVDLFFADDSKQRKPSRRGIKSLVGIGGICLPIQKTSSLTAHIDQLCVNYGFPPGEKFKWSPDRKLWMHRNLVKDRRASFFQELLGITRIHDARAIVIVSDSTYETATGANSAEVDVFRMFLERAEIYCSYRESISLIVVDRPGGKRSDESKFLSDCLETLQTGTDYIIPEHMAHNVLCTDSNYSRLLQTADIIIGCVVAAIGGERNFALPLLERIIPLLHRSSISVGGCGVKLHPDYKFLNLYHWLFKDDSIDKGGTLMQLPDRRYPYFESPDSL